MTASHKPARTGAAPEGWQAAFLHALRQTGNVSAAARAAGTCRSRCYEARQRDRGFAAIPTDGVSVGTTIFGLFEAPWGRHYANNFTFRPVGGRQNLSERLHTVIFDRQMRPQSGRRIDYGEWRCIHASVHGIQNTGGFFGTFVRVA